MLLMGTSVKVPAGAPAAVVGAGAAAAAAAAAGAAAAACRQKREFYPICIQSSAINLKYCKLCC